MCFRTLGSSKDYEVLSIGVSVLSVLELSKVPVSLGPT